MEVAMPLFSTMFRLIVLLLICTVFCFAQKQNNIWQFGNGVGIDFNVSPPKLVAFPKDWRGDYWWLQDYQWSAGKPITVSDPITGTLLFYTDGDTIWDRNHNPMSKQIHWWQRGVGEHSYRLNYYNAIAIPVYQSPYSHYIVSLHYDRSNITGTFTHATSIKIAGINMKLNSGLGDVDVIDSIDVAEPFGLTAIAHCNGRQSWLIVNDVKFYAFPISSSGIKKPIISNPIMHSHYDILQVSHDGQLIAVAGNYRRTESLKIYHEINIYSFDKGTGTVSLLQNLQYPNNYSMYDLIFSPDNSKLYVTTITPDTVTTSGLGMILQYDLSRNGELSYKIIREGIGDMELAPDGRIYMTDGSYNSSQSSLNSDTALSIIEKPNLNGSACRFISKGFSLKGKLSGMWLPKPTIYLQPNDIGLTVTSDTVICDGESVQLYAEGANDYHWTPATGLSCTDCPNPVATPDSTTTYTLSAIRLDCPATQSVTITVRPLPSVEQYRDTAICLGSTTMLGARKPSVGVRYVWDPDPSLSCTDCPNPIATPTATTQYRVVVTTAEGCSDTATPTVTILPRPPVQLTNDTAICTGNSVQLSLTGGNSVQWLPTDGLSCTDCFQPIATPTTTTTYVATILSDKGCFISDSVTITVVPPPMLAITSSPDTSICLGEVVQLRATGGASYQWLNSEDLSCSDCPNPIATPKQTTTYSVIVANGMGCSDTTAITIVVITPEVNAGEDTAICPGGSVQLSASKAISYQWSPAVSLSCTDCPNPIASPTATTIYKVIGTDMTGCAAVDSVIITVLSPAFASAGADTTICSTGVAYLQATDGVAYQWEPTTGLRCPTCQMTEAHPPITTDYVVHIQNADGCSASDTVRVRIDTTQRVIQAFIGRGYRYTPGILQSIPIELHNPIGAVEIMELSLQYDPRILRIGGIGFSNSLLQGWDIVSETNDIITGKYTARIQGVSGGRINGTGNLLFIYYTGFLGAIDSAEMRFQLSLQPEECRIVETSPGLVRVDSICGLNFRLIEAKSENYSLEDGKPNPFNPTTRIGFSLGLDGPTRVEIIDISGRLVGVLVDKHLQEGRYEVEWDGGNYPSGLYICRLQSGHWSQSQFLMLVK